jgi:hypothetical protein
MYSMIWIGTPVNHLLFSRAMGFRLFDFSLNIGRVEGAYTEDIIHDGRTATMKTEVTLQGIELGVYYRLLDSASIWGYAEIGYYSGKNSIYLTSSGGGSTTTTEHSIKRVAVGGGIFRSTQTRIFWGLMSLIVGLGYNSQRGIQLLLGVGTID